MDIYGKMKRERKALITPEIYNALDLLSQIQSQVTKGQQNPSFDTRVLSQVNNDLNLMLSVLSNPVFQKICKIQDSIGELEDQLTRHPSCTTSDFDINAGGKLEMKISPDEKRQPFDKTPLPQIPTSASNISSNSLISKLGGSEVEILPPITTPSYAFEFDKVVNQSALGRQIHTIKLFKPEGCSLGFSVVGLKSKEAGELGIFVQEIQPNGIAARDGRLCVSDQILAISGVALDSAVTHQEAIGVLQRARGDVELLIARHKSREEECGGVGESVGGFLLNQPPPSSPTQKQELNSENSDMVLNTEWAQVEAILLENDGTGLGFGIIGGRSTGVVVKTILPGGVADRQGRLQSGDHILQIGDVNLLGMGSDQVAAVLRQQCGSSVRLVVARPCEPSSPDCLLSESAPIVPTRVLGDPEELERHLLSAGGGSRTEIRVDNLPEVEIVDVELVKDAGGLGITIAGYVCEKEELSGIFVKSISEGSAAACSGKICINDRIVEVDGQSLTGFTNHQAVEVLRQTGEIVYLKLERYHHGSKFDQLQSAISHSEHKQLTTPSSLSAFSSVTLPQVNVDSDGEEEEILETGVEEEDAPDSLSENEDKLVNSSKTPEFDLEDLIIDSRYDGELLPHVEAAIVNKWAKILGNDCDIVVAQIEKGKDGGGLGISLEGTVDVEDGREVRPHHYIRSVLPDGPIGRNSKLMSGDELLEVNGRRLLGLNHVEVVGILKDLPMNVRIVCARHSRNACPIIDTSQDRSAFAARNLLGGSMQDILFPGSERLVKAKSDGSLASTSTTTTDGNGSLCKIKSRSLEPLTGLAMWSSEAHVIELPKGDRGLGFSILDYQDPLNTSETVIVIRSLVPCGVAQQDGRLIPGDRLLGVNDIVLENASLDEAVQALKGAPRGIVRITIAKPVDLVVQDESGQSPPSDEENIPPPLPISPPPDLESRYFDEVKLRAAPVAQERLINSNNGVSGSRNSNAQNQLIYQKDLSNIPGRRCSGDGEESESIKSQPIRTPDDKNLNFEPIRAPVEKSLNFEPIRGSDSSKFGPIKTERSSLVIPPPDQKRVVTHITIFPSPLQNSSTFKEALILNEENFETKNNNLVTEKIITENSVTNLIKDNGSNNLNLVDKNVINESLVLSSANGEKLVKNGSDEKMVKSDSVEKMVRNAASDKLAKIGLNEKLVKNECNDEVVKSVIIDKMVKSDSVEQMGKSGVSDKMGKSGQSGHNDKMDKNDKMVRSGSVEKSSGDEGALLLAKHWGPEKLVEVYREANKSLGISIVGGKVDLYNSGPDSGTSAISGIFIKNVLPNSPAGRTGLLKTGSRILAVDDVDLRSASHEKAVEIIRAAGNPVKFLVQSLVQWSDAVSGSIDDDSRSEGTTTTTTNSVSTRGPGGPHSSSCTDFSFSSYTTTTSASHPTSSRYSSTSTWTSSEGRVTERVRGGEEVISEEELLSEEVRSEEEIQRQMRSGEDSEEEEEEVKKGMRSEEEKVKIKMRSDEENKRKKRSEEENKRKMRSDEEGSEEEEIERALRNEEGDEEEREEGLTKVGPRVVTPIQRSPSPDLIQHGLGDDEKQEIQSKLMSAKEGDGKSVDEDDEDEDDEESGDLQGRVRTKANVEIDRASAGFVKMSKDEISNDPETEDQFGYTQIKINKRWLDVANHSGGKLIVVSLEKTVQELGFSLAGHKDRMKMGTYICGIHPHGQAKKKNILKVGDEILEINGHVLYGRSHLNASVLIKSLPHSHVRIVLLRKPDAVEECLSVKPLVQFPLSLESERPEEKYANYKGLRMITLTKIGGGLGIMIMEGRHGELGTGIFISDIQEGSVAEQSGLYVGDMILAVNGCDFVGVDYETAASTLKKTEGNVALVVCNASKSKQKDEEKNEDEKSSTGGENEGKLEVDKPKLPPKPTKIPSPSKISSVLSTIRKSISPTPQSSQNQNLTQNANFTQNQTLTQTQTLTQNQNLTQIQNLTQNSSSAGPMHINDLNGPIDSNFVSKNDKIVKMGVKNVLGGAVNPGVAEIVAGRETIIEINKDRGLGISILGGSDTVIGSIIIQEVYPDGAAAKDGRLKPGDQLLFVNNEDFQNISHSRALAALRQTPPKIRMVVYRAEAKEEECYDVKEVELVRRAGRGLGLSISSSRSGKGVFISDVVPGGIAQSDGRLTKGDRILAVNGKDLKESSQEEAASVLKTALGTINMRIGRFKTGGNKNLSSLPKDATEISEISTNSFVDPEDLPLTPISNIKSENGECENSPPTSLAGSPPKVRTVILERGVDGLGFSIVGGVGSQHGNLPIYIKSIFERGAAAREGSLKRGDQLLTVNGMRLEGLSHSQAVLILKNSKGSVTLSILS